jgi:Uma2 family endonuclease
MSLAQTSERTESLVTAEALWQLAEDDQDYELVKGELVKVTPPGGTHGKVSLRLGALLQNFVVSHQLGVVMVETGFRLAANPDTVRGPDISFLSADRIPADGLPEGYISGAPDLAVEIVSPNDRASEIQARVQDYLTSGTPLVWVVYPQQRLVIVHYPDGTARTLSENDTLSGETVIVGFSCQVKEIFS